MTLANRTIHDRRAFTLNETATASHAELMAERAAAATPSVPTISKHFFAPTPTQMATKQAALLRESTAEFRRTAFVRALGEIVYQSVPMDEHEKVAFHDAIVEQTADVFARCGSWDLSPVGKTLSELTDEFAALGVDGANTLSEAAGEPATELGRFVADVSSAIERRVVAAVLTSQERADAHEAALMEAGENAEHAARLKHRANKRQQPMLLEALFITNTRSLTERAGDGVESHVILAEAIAQYTCLETLSALGVIKIDDIGKVTRAISVV